MALARRAVNLAKGRSQSTVRAAADDVAARLVGMVQPFATPLFAQHRAAGRPIVLATTTPYDLVKPFADLLGLDAVVATRYGVNADGTYDGTLDRTVRVERRQPGGGQGVGVHPRHRPAAELRLQRQRLDTRRSCRPWAIPSP